MIKKARNCSCADFYKCEGCPIRRKSLLCSYSVSSRMKTFGQLAQDVELLKEELKSVDLSLPLKFKQKGVKEK